MLPLRALWHPWFVRAYDALLGFSERAGLRRRRRALLAEAAGRTVEIGAGTGLNLGLYPAAVTDLVLTEPDPDMAARLRERAARGRRRGVRVVEAPGERLPFADASFDTAVVTLVLCTVEDPAAVLREIARVLRRGGALLFLEHVRSEDDPRLARWQDRLQRVWEVVGDGCRCNRRTRAVLEASPLRVERLAEGTLPFAPPWVRPTIAGTARRTGGPPSTW